MRPGAHLVQQPAEADVRLVCETNELRQLRTRPSQITIALVTGGDPEWPRLLRSAEVDAVVADKAATRLSRTDIAFDPFDAATTEQAALVESARTKPRLCIGTSVRFARRALLWGDTHFAYDVAESMQRRGWRTTVRAHGQLTRSANRGNDALLYLRGLRPPPRVDTPVALWVISHPADVAPQELAKADQVFAAGQIAANRLGAIPLLQATNPRRFFPADTVAELRSSLLFVGNGRGRHRPSVSHALAAGMPVHVVGPGWKNHDGLTRVSKGVPNENLHQLYSSAAIVLNDHWPDMRDFGILSNRLFDALACGSSVVSDQVDGIDEILGSNALTYHDQASFVEAIHHSQSEADLPSASAARRNLVVQKHTFDHRASILDSRLRALVQRPGTERLE